MDSCFCRVRVNLTWNIIHPWGPGIMRSLSFHASRDHSALFSCIRLKCTRNSMLPSAPFRGDSIHPLLRNPKPSTPFVIFSRTYTLEANSFHIFAWRYQVISTLVYFVNYLNCPVSLEANLLHFWPYNS